MPIRNGGAFFVLLCFDRTIGLLQDVVHAKTHKLLHPVIS